DYNSSDSVRDRPFLKVQFVPPPQPLVLAYDMETLTPDGRMKDGSGNGNNGEITGTSDVQGKSGRGWEFNGISDEITAVLPRSGLGQWTVALWVNWQDGTGVYEHPIGLGMRHDATFWFSGTTLAFKTTDAFGNTVVQQGLSSSVTTGTWYHLAATFDGTIVAGYLNGIAAFSVAGPATTIRSNNVRIGAPGNDASNFFAGVIDEVFIYSRVLNAAEIASLAPRPPPSEGPILSYDMDNLTFDGRIKDSSGNSNHGTMTGTTQALGKLGQAREFDGADDKVAAFVPVAGLTQWTIALWAEWQDGPKTYAHPVGLGTEHDATFWFSGTTLAFKTQDASGNTVIEKH